MKEEGEHRLADRLWEETGKLIPSRRGPRHFPSWCTPVYSSETFRSREREGRLMLRESVPLSLSLSLFISLSSILVPPSFPLFSPSLHPSFPRGSTNDTPTNRLREQLSVKLLLRLLAAATQSTRWRLCNTIEAEKYRRLSVITRPILHVPTSIDYERVFLSTGSIEVSLPGCSIFPEQVNKGSFFFFPQRSDNRCLYDFRVC